MAPSRNQVQTTRFVTLATYAANRPVEGRVVTVLASSHETRGLKLIPTYSRAVLKDAIHELIATDETDKRPGDTVNRIAYLAFFEILQSGCLIVGETLSLGARMVGTIIGFDETHEPNHINIIVHVRQRLTGAQLKFAVGKKVRFAQPK